MGIHESQSRLFENLVGRSRAFVHYLYPTLKELFPAQLADVSADEILARRQPRRTGPDPHRGRRADLLLHIMVRYELEKALMQGTLAVADLPAAWNAKYKEYLGVDVPDDAHGCLQDIHWVHGRHRLFPELCPSAVPTAHRPSTTCAKQTILTPSGPTATWSR